MRIEPHIDSMLPSHEGIRSFTAAEVAEMTRHIDDAQLALAASEKASDAGMEFQTRLREFERAALGQVKDVLAKIKEALLNASR
jgi:hypothetical protein